MSSSTPEIDRSPSSAKGGSNINECLLTNAFDDCLKLVEKSINNTTTTSNNKGSSKTRKEIPSKTVKTEPHKVEMTHKSRKFRYSDDDKAVGNSSIIIPPPLDPESLPMSENEDEARASMLMSWYMAGYHTGYFEAMKKFKQR